MGSNDTMRNCLIGYSILMVLAYLAFGSVLVYTGKRIEEHTTQGTAYVKQMTRDWDRKPYVDVKVVDMDDNFSLCPDGWNEVYENIWGGQRGGCDCLGICGEFMDGCNDMHLDDTCRENQTMYGCREFGGFPPIWQSQIQGRRICGEPGGDNFLNVTRPDVQNQCPEDFVPCSQNTDAESTVCYPADTDLEKVCPITDIQFVENDHAQNYTDIGYKAQVYNQTTKMVYTKDAPNLPITSTKIEYQPCMDSLFQSKSIGQFYYEPEIMDTGCKMEKNNMLEHDPRYIENGLNTDQWELRSESSVYTHLMTQPSYATTGPLQPYLQSYKVSGWNRPTIGWSLECEARGKTRQEGYEAALTDLARYEYVKTYKRVGIAMTVLFSLSAAVAFAALFFKERITGIYLVHLFVQVCYIIMAPIVGARMYDEMDVNENNVVKLQNFAVINECGDKYTNVDIEMINSELDQALAYSELIEILFWATMGMLFFEIVSIIPLIACFKSGSRGGGHQPHRPNQQPAAIQKVDPEAEFIAAAKQAQTTSPVYDNPAGGQPTSPVYPAVEQPTQPVYSAAAQPPSSVFPAVEQPTYPVYPVAAQPPSSVFPAAEQPPSSVFPVVGPPTSAVYDNPVVGPPIQPVYDTQAAGQLQQLVSYAPQGNQHQDSSQA